MKLSDMKNRLAGLEDLNFRTPEGTPIPSHFHITEAGLTTKHFIDCGGTIRQETVINFQIFLANDTGHRLSPQKLAKIIAKSEEVLPLGDREIEVEYMTNTIGRYGLEFDGHDFQLTAKHTDCLAKDNCGIGEKKKVALSELNATKTACCSPESKCC
jgi:hypothetical protein